MQKLVEDVLHSSKWQAVLFLLIVGVASLRIVRTYHFYNQSIDEPAHVNCGLEWLSQGTFKTEPQHPPLPRVLMAIGPYLRGARFDPNLKNLNEGNDIFHKAGDYWETLISARVATLFWFFLACTFLFLFARRWCGGVVALLAVFLFSLLPSVLTHAGMATNDMAATAALIFILYSFSRYWSEPGFGNASLSGVALAVAFGSKMSLFLFIPLTVVPFLFTLGLPRTWTRQQLLRSLSHAAVFLAVAVFLLSALYRFELTPAARLGNLPLPLNGLKLGLLQLMAHNKDGHEAVFWGEYHRFGSKLFFPVMLLLKTPLGILTLVVAGYAGLLFRWKTWAVPVKIALWAAPAIVAACMMSSINIGLRHVLPVYPMLALAGALALTLVPRRIPASALRAVLGLSLMVGLVESATAFTDPLPWFNVLAPEPRDFVTVDSDLDWGQNIYRLSKYLKEEKIEKLGLFYFGSVNSGVFDFPKATAGVDPMRPTPGYVVVSSYIRRLECLKSGKFCWLNQFQPEYSIGDSIHIYYIPGASLARP
jgi:hypothetical protein